MCAIRQIHYRDCDHIHDSDWLWCSTARNRTPPEACTNPERTLDVQDTNTPPPCPVCAGETPPDSDRSSSEAEALIWKARGEARGKARSKTVLWIDELHSF